MRAGVVSNIPALIVCCENKRRGENLNAKVSGSSWQIPIGLKGTYPLMSSVIEFASQVINDDPSRVHSFILFVVHISDTPRDPVKAAYRTELLKFLCEQTPESESLCDRVLKEAEKAFEEANGALSSSAPH